MRNRALHGALRDFAVEAAAHLSAEVAAGAELGFDVAEEPGSGSVLYRYRPLTEEFIAERWPALRALPSAQAATHLLGDGAAAYLRVRGHDGADAEPALRAMVERLYEDASGLSFPEDRFERVYAEVERTLYRDVQAAEVICPLIGTVLRDCDRLELDDGLALVRAEELAAPEDAAWPAGREGDPGVACLLSREVAPGDPLPFDEARARFPALVAGLRLFKAGGIALGPVAWGRADEGPWQAAPLVPTGHARDAALVLRAGERDELNRFLSIWSRAATRAGALEWAARRFEMGAARALDTEALTDYLLALRALLDGGDEVGRASLSLRLAALCAEESARRAMARRVESAFALERFVIGGGSADGYLDTIGCESPSDLVLELEGHLRALLRDVFCGYLDPNLKTVADDILLASSEPLDIRAGDLRGEPSPDEVMTEPSPDEVFTEPSRNAVTDEALEEAGVTPSTDWAPDPPSTDWAPDPPSPSSSEWDFDDPQDYSAPV